MSDYAQYSKELFVINLVKMMFFSAFNKEQNLSWISTTPKWSPFWGAGN
jgi:hypothetical protein